MEKYYIEHVAEYCDIPKSKLRYYEKKEILKNIERDSNNKRLYTKDDIEMIKFIKCLSNLNMPLKDIQTNTNNYAIAHKQIEIADSQYLKSSLQFRYNEISSCNAILKNGNAQ